MAPKCKTSKKDQDAVALYRKELESVMVLLMYEDPLKSPMGSILSDDSLL